jgi:hypothetical protein
MVGTGEQLSTHLSVRKKPAQQQGFGIGISMSSSSPMSWSCHVVDVQFFGKNRGNDFQIILRPFLSDFDDRGHAMLAPNRQRCPE